jgi:FlaA1/EpsC-like NDP-sugar epimerase
METNLCEAVSNNVLGTRNLAHVAENAGASHFILISTDKAVNPTSIMGVTKRIAELLVYQVPQRDGACFSAVRFGNVLGSRGSVVNTFKRQIAQGGPVTVTHPEMRRFFMTIPEAVQLVLQAAALGQGGEVFVLDMGEQIRIVDLATDLVRLSGLRPRVRVDDGDVMEDGEPWDIEIVFTGARAGEKLYEELFAEGEDCQPTRHEKIMVAENGHDRFARVHLDERLARLAEMVQTGDADRTQLLLQEIVPEYTPQPQEDSGIMSSGHEAKAEVGRARRAA